VIEAEGVIALCKTEITAYLLLGEAYFRLNQLPKAAEILHTALMLNPYNLTVHERYRAVKEQQLQLDIEAWQARLQDDQWNAALHFELAKGFWLKGEKDKAMRELQIVQKDPLRAPQALNMLGNIYRSEGRYDLAITNYNQALGLTSKEQAKNIRFNLGTANEALGWLRKAIKIYEEITQEDIDYGNLKKRLKQLKATSLISMCNKALLMSLADYGRSEIVALWGRENRLTGRSSGKKEEVNVSFGQEHNDAGFDYYLRGMYQAAEEEFALATQLDRHFATALNNLVVTLVKQGKFDEARLKMIEATELNPVSSVFYNNLGVVYLLLEKNNLAKVALEKSLELDPDNSAACLNLGDLYYQKKEIQKALDLYRKVGEFDPLADLIERRLLYKIP
jgi:tetratricopeptide (TPR) repeat protein